MAAAGSFFFWSSVLSAFSYPVAARLAKRVGLVNTMVFTHIPSSICLILAAFAPDLAMVVALLLVRSALSQMDVPTRTSYVMAVVTPAERTAAAGVTAVPRSLAASLSPALSGVLLASSFSGLPLVICGCLKIVYDLALLMSFRHIKPPEEQATPFVGRLRREGTAARHTSARSAAGGTAITIFSSAGSSGSSFCFPDGNAVELQEYRRRCRDRSGHRGCRRFRTASCRGSPRTGWRSSFRSSRIGMPLR